MPIFGAPTYLPSPGFAFPRPYVEQISFNFGAGAIITQNVSEFVITDGGNPNVHVICNFLPAFWATSSNRYTVDYVIKDWWLIIDPNPTQQPLNFTVTYFIDPVTIVPELFVGIAGATTRYTFALPPAPPDYWTPT